MRYNLSNSSTYSDPCSSPIISINPTESNAKSCEENNIFFLLIKFFLKRDRKGLLTCSNFFFLRLYISSISMTN